MAADVKREDMSPKEALAELSYALVYALKNPSADVKSLSFEAPAMEPDRAPISRTGACPRTRDGSWSVDDLQKLAELVGTYARKLPG